MVDIDLVTPMFQAYQSSAKSGTDKVTFLSKLFGKQE